MVAAGIIGCAVVAALSWRIGGSGPTADARDVSLAPAAVQLTLDQPAIVTAAATRGAKEQIEALPAAPAPSTAVQDAVCLPAAHVPERARIVVDVRAQSTTSSVATLRLLQRVDSGVWTCVGRPMSARVGRSGVKPLANRVGGDGSTPSGVFELGVMTAPDGQTFSFFGNGSNPGVASGWRQVQVGDCWWADPGTADYNTLVTRVAASCRGENEYLPGFVNSYFRVLRSSLRTLAQTASATNLVRLRVPRRFFCITSATTLLAR